MKITGKTLRRVYSGDLTNGHLCVPDGVEVIDKDAMMEVEGELRSISIPSTVKQMRENAFCKLVLKAVYITNLAAWCAIKFDRYWANPLWNAERVFVNGVETQDLVIPDGVTSIGAYAFSCVKLRSVTIPASVTSIGEDAFSTGRARQILYKGTPEQWKDVNKDEHWGGGQSVVIQNV